MGAERRSSRDDDGELSACNALKNDGHRVRSVGIRRQREKDQSIDHTPVSRALEEHMLAMVHMAHASVAPHSGKTYTDHR
jgi:hypothetical protein